MAARYKTTARIFSRRPRRSVAKKARRARVRNQPQAGQISEGTCCVDLDLMTVVCTNPNDPRHGANVSDIGDDTGQGLMVAWQSETTSGSDFMQPCGTSTDCCYDAVQGIIVCSDTANVLHGQQANVVEQLEGGMVYVCFSTGRQTSNVPCFNPDTNQVVGGPWDGMSPPAGVAYSEDGSMVTIFGLDPQGVIDPVLPVCTPGQTCLRIPLCADQPPVSCCYDAVNGVLQCDDAALNGQVPTLISEGTDADGKPYVVVQHPALNNGNRTQIALCPDQPPPDCCYDLAAGVLRCPGNPEFDGLEPTGIVQITQDMVSAQHPDLPGGAWDFPLCIDETPPDCCYDGKLKVLVCPNDPDYNGRPAGVVATFEGEDGRTWVQVAWEGGGARMPLCTEECPPIFCCVNTETMTFVCADGDLNDQPADIVDIVTVAGFNMAVLSDGTRVPVCGGDCPPPKYCPPGLWMSPDGECTTPPECPPETPCPPQIPCPPQGGCPPQIPCPPGGQPPGFVPPGNGACPDPCFPLGIFGHNANGNDRSGNPWWKKEGHCCEECALGKECAGAAGGCDCGETHTKGILAEPLKFTSRSYNPRRRRVARYRRTRKLLGL